MSEIFTEPTPDFGDAVLVIQAYHQRMLACCEQIRELAMQVELKTTDADSVKTAFAVQVFLVTATELHHRDEELALFPHLCRVSDMMDGMLEKLAEDHDEIEQVWAIIQPKLANLASLSASADSEEFVNAARRYAQLLQWHIEREDDNFLPEVTMLLTAQERANIAKHMAQLRLNSSK